ncbi:M23 family metallopeptidase [Chelativorans sp. AA-79]|uniref:M23 family metallopeptidase n=1 Tax=Chelativorans sp. AA-79 TaxID=3028735 RepID=UPI0023F6EE34|nr:M23 family metallopeptidase [Chelativorans sp. AA-79]WEX07322.1 M23 family metallopeptidase [Chelativorans sp. AA-79]
MLLGITQRHRTLLGRGAAVLLIGGLAGCSSTNFTDGLTTSSTAPVTVAQANQPYPGDVVRPKADVGGGGILQPAAPVSSLPPPSAPTYGASTSAAPVSSNVSSSPLPPPGGASRSAAAPAPVEQPRSSGGQMAAVPQAPKPQAQGGTYTVASGDTLYAISRRTGVSVDRLKQANGLGDGSIRIGQELAIPGASTAVASAAPARKSDPVNVSATPSAKPAAQKPVVAANTKKPEAEEEPKVTAYTPPAESKPKAVEAVDQTEVAALTPEATGVGRLRWPAQGRVIGSFGSNGGRKNDGVDIAVPEGTAVHAAENGVVIYAGDGLKGFGNTVLVRHEDGLVTVYGHASELKVKRGDKVRRGQEIALSGMTGDAERPKLHFEVRKGTSPVDPMTYLR